MLAGLGKSIVRDDRLRSKVSRRVMELGRRFGAMGVLLPPTGSVPVLAPGRA